MYQWLMVGVRQWAIPVIGFVHISNPLLYFLFFFKEGNATATVVRPTAMMVLVEGNCGGTAGGCLMTAIPATMILTKSASLLLASSSLVSFSLWDFKKSANPFTILRSVIDERDDIPC
jgi:hypothetical protein